MPLLPADIDASRRTSALQYILAATILAVAVLLLLATARTTEGFVWTDAATFALNGQLLLDYLTSAFPSNPVTFAQHWFLHYPAITISLYPPIFPLVEAAMFALFGFSHVVAQTTVTLFAAVAAYGMWLMARTALPALQATAATLTLFSTPIILVWSRQVMMEIPTLSFLLVGCGLFLQYQASRSVLRLFLAVTLLLASIYTKQTSIFAVLAFAAALFVDEGSAFLRRPSIWIAIGFGTLCLLPLFVFTLMFSPDAIEVASRHDLADVQTSRFSFDALTVYARSLPSMVGWLPLAATLGYATLVIMTGWKSVSERRLSNLMLAWFVAEYLFVTFVGHFEERYGIALAVPIATSTVMLASRIIRQSLAGPAILTAGCVMYAAALISWPMPHTGSYTDVASRIITDAAQDDVVLFHGNDSKSLAFELRAAKIDPKIYLIRSEKAFLGYHFVTEPTVKDLNLSTTDLEQQLDRLGISWVILQPDFWTDQPSMLRLQNIVYSDRFKEIAEFQIMSDVPTARATLKIFKSTKPVIKRLDANQLLSVSNRR